MLGSVARGDDRAERGSRLATMAYVAAWLVAATVLVGVVLAVLDDGEPAEVSLPPVHETELDIAARDADCTLHRARSGDLNPPVVGGLAARPARPGVYEESPGTAALTAALRDGMIVIQFRNLDDSGRDLLRVVQEAVPEGTIVAPNETEMPFVVAVAAYRRLLGCRRFDDATVEAIQLFRGRYVGSGPGA